MKVEEAEAFVERVKAQYGPYKGMKEEEVRENAFITRPGMGAGGECFNLNTCMGGGR